MQATWRPPLAPYAGLQCTDRRDHPGAVVMAEAEEKKAMLAAAKKELMELDNEIGKHEKSLGADEDTADEAEADDVRASHASSHLPQPPAIAPVCGLLRCPLPSLARSRAP
eukprot:2512669-Prymnesium_polylepis.1